MRGATSDLRALLDAAQREGEPAVSIAGAERRRLRDASGESLVDTFADGAVRCLFRRAVAGEDAGFGLRGAYRMTTAAAGGWLLEGEHAGQPSYWFPCLPMLRRVDADGRILEQAPCPIAALAVGTEGAEIRLRPAADRMLDLVVWELADPDARLLPQLTALDGAERHPAYMWGSHGVYREPADLYRHLVHGSVFDLRFSWPFKRRAYSENDSHALYLTLRNRELATGKSIYRHLRDQVLLGLLDRQDANGGWRQGIWTRDMERHFRLHNKAMHLLMDCYAERPDPGLLGPLARAADFLAAQATEVMGETWFLHDSLEQDEQAIRAGLPGWRRCANPIKTPANTLVLNTHVDTLLVLHRYRQVSGRTLHDTRVALENGDTAVTQGSTPSPSLPRQEGGGQGAPAAIVTARDFDAQIESARRVLLRVLALKPAETLYRLVFGATYLTLLPTKRAKALPLHLRALKRLARERLMPLLPTLKCRYPRLVMPGGYIDRALSLDGVAHAYLGIHLMDLARYERCFPGEAEIGRAISGMMAFAKQWDLLASWAEVPHAEYGIGYWVEALYQLALLDDRPELRHALGETAILSERCGLGLPPSMAGTNLEMLELERQRPCPIPADPRLRTINLARDDRSEYVFLNPETGAVPFALSGPPSNVLWHTSGAKPSPEPPDTLGPGQWLWAAPLSG